MRLELNATLLAVDEAVAEAAKVLGNVLGGTQMFGVLLGLREAVTNSVVHGSMLDPDKRVTCEITVEDGKLKVEVADEGDGFNWREPGVSSFPDPTIPGSRGIGIITTYFDQAIYNEKGNKLLLTKRLL